MLSAVQLYHQTPLRAHKINDVRADWMLASELVSASLVGMEFGSKKWFGWCGLRRSCLARFISKLRGFIRNC